MQSTKKLNVKLLRRIQAHILEEPRRFFMSGLLQRGKPGTKFESDNFTLQEIPKCGTAACIAGWACLLSKSKHTDAGVAGRLLNIEQDETNPLPGDFLFYDWNWPEPFKTQYEKAKTPDVRAKIASARIEHLITTGE